MPKNYMTEDGPRPDFAELFGALEHESPLYPPRTLANAGEATLTIWVGSGDTAGRICTSRAVAKVGARWETVLSPVDPTPVELADLIRSGGHARINVAGPRESSRRGIGERSEVYLFEVFRRALATPQEAASLLVKQLGYPGWLQSVGYGDFSPYGGYPKIAVMANRKPYPFEWDIPAEWMGYPLEFVEVGPLVPLGGPC